MSAPPSSLQCSICMCDFNEPRLLDCFHTFCTPCLVPILQKWSNKSVFPCPLCRKPIDIPRNGVNGFQKNFYISKSSQDSQNNDSKKTCVLCDHVKVLVCKCLECAGLLCDSCRQIHPRMKLTKHHKLVSLKTELKGTRCTIHKDQVQSMYCIFCKLKICSKCSSELHSGHDIEYISVAAERERQKLREVAANLMEYRQTIDAALDPVRHVYKQLNKNITRMKTDAHEHCEKMKLQVDESLIQFYEKLVDIRTKMKSDMMSFAENVTSKREIVNDIQILIQEIESGSDADILDGSRPIFNRLLMMVKDKPSLVCQELRFVEREVPFHGQDAIGCVVRKFSHELGVSAPQNILHNPIYDIKLITSFSSPNAQKDIAGIIPISDNFACIYFNKGNKIHIINKDGEEKRMIQMPGRFDCVAVCSIGGLLAISHKDNVVWRVDKTYTDVTKRYAFDQHPGCVCCTRSHIYVTFSKVVSYLHMDVSSNVVQFDLAMNEIQNTSICAQSKDEDGDSGIEFGAINGLHELPDGDLVVLEYTQKSNIADRVSNLLILSSSNLQVKHRHKCVANDGRQLKPSNICTDVYGNIFITETQQKRVLRFNRQTHEFEEFLNADKGLVNPACVAVDGTDHFWVGDSNKGHVFIFRYMK